jgi:sugar transport protein
MPTSTSILAFFATVFFSLNTQDPSQDAIATVDKSLGPVIGFGAANAVFSTIAYFLIEPRRDEDVGVAVQPDDPRKKRLQFSWLFGRRSLLLLSLGGGTVMLFILTLLLNRDSPSLPLVVIFIILFTLFYSPGGCVPFVYSAEVWPNDCRGMSRPTSRSLP